MKTLKYLMLLLAVAIALPAVAQEMNKKAYKDATFLDKEAGKVVFFEKEGAKKASDATQVRVGKYEGQVQVVNGVLEATLVSPKGYTLKMIKDGSQKQLVCTGDAKYCKGMPNFKYERDDALQETDDVQDEIAWDAYAEEEEEVEE